MRTGFESRLLAGSQLVMMLQLPVAEKSTLL